MNLAAINVIIWQEKGYRTIHHFCNEPTNPFVLASHDCHKLPKLEFAHHIPLMDAGFFRKIFEPQAHHSVSVDRRDITGQALERTPGPPPSVVHLQNHTCLPSCLANP